MRIDEDRIEFSWDFEFHEETGVRFRGNRVGFTCFVHRSPFLPYLLDLLAIKIIKVSHSYHHAFIRPTISFSSLPISSIRPASTHRYFAKKSSKVL
jgi:hypothetical protein